MNNMEIKVGDKVRVSKDAPKMYVPVSFWTEGNSIVEEIHEGNAAISYESNYADFRIVVPIKYLLVNVNGVWKKPKTKPKRTRKVEAEAKEAKFKYRVGQKVKSVCADEILTIKEHCGRVGHDNVYRVEEYTYTWNECELKPYTEPTEQTEARTKTKGDTLVFPFAFDLSDSYWDAYTADLAKEVVLKVANKFNDPKEAAEYAVKVAKAVVEGLKRK